MEKWYENHLDENKKRDKDHYQILRNSSREWNSAFGGNEQLVTLAGAKISVEPSVEQIRQSFQKSNISVCGKNL